NDPFCGRLVAIDVKESHRNLIGSNFMFLGVQDWTIAQLGLVKCHTMTKFMGSKVVNDLLLIEDARTLIPGQQLHLTSRGIAKHAGRRSFAINLCMRVKGKTQDGVRIPLSSLYSGNCVLIKRADGWVCSVQN